MKIALAVLALVLTACEGTPLRDAIDPGARGRRLDAAAMDCVQTNIPALNALQGHTVWTALDLAKFCREYALRNDIEAQYNRMALGNALYGMGNTLTTPSYQIAPPMPSAPVTTCVTQGVFMTCR